MRYGRYIIAIILAALAALVVMRMPQSSAPQAGASVQQEEVKMVRVYVAATTIAPGTLIEPEMITLQPWPERMVLDGFVREGATSGVSGMLARASFQVGEPILSSKVANPLDANFLAGNLPKGMRAVTIKTDMIDSVSGFVFPGDRVDVMVTRKVPKTIADRSSGYGVRVVDDSITETLLTNVQVLAVDRKAEAGSSVDPAGTVKAYPESVSVMVSQEDAQRLRLGEDKGRLSLTLRGMKDRDGADPLILTTTQDISQYQDTSPLPQAAPVGVAGRNAVTVIRGTAVDQGSAPANRPASPLSPFAPQAVSQPTLGQ